MIVEFTVQTKGMTGTRVHQSGATPSLRRRTVVGDGLLPGEQDGHHSRHKGFEDAPFPSLSLGARPTGGHKNVLWRRLLGVALPAGLTVKVHEEDAATAHLVLPPDSKLGESELQAVAGGTRYDQNGVPIQSEYIPWSNW